MTKQKSFKCSNCGVVLTEKNKAPGFTFELMEEMPLSRLCQECSQRHITHQKHIIHMGLAEELTKRLNRTQSQTINDFNKLLKWEGISKLG